MSAGLKLKPNLASKDILVETIYSTESSKSIAYISNESQLLFRSSNYLYPKSQR